MTVIMSSRVICPMCPKDYADQKGFKKHLIGVHQLKFDVASNSIRKLEGEELNEAIRTLRHMQSHRETPVHRGLSPPALSEHSSMNRLVHTLDVVRPECSSLEIPLLEPVVPLNLSTHSTNCPTLSVFTRRTLTRRFWTCHLSASARLLPRVPPCLQPPLCQELCRMLCHIALPRNSRCLLGRLHLLLKSF